MKKPFWKLSAVFLVAFCALALGRGLIFAQSNGLGVTPKQSFTMRAGETASNSLFLSNLNPSQPLTVHINVVDFEAQNESGGAKLLQSSNQPLTPWSLKPYLTIPEFVSVPAGQSKSIPFTLKLPANVGAGTYYSAVEYTATSGNNQQQVNIAASTATLLFINVPGQAKELMTMKSFGMSENNKITSVFHKLPTFFDYRIQNSGNVAEQPAGSLVIKNMFGKVVANVDNANPKAQLALIGQTRRFQGCNTKSKTPEELPKDSNCIPFQLSPGLYTATLAILYGQNGQPTQQIGATAHFWYLPWSFVVMFLIVLVAAIAAIYWLYRKVSGRRRR